FAPAGRIAADGTFRWTTTEEAEIVLRAWPWKSPPSPAQSFACRDGARHAGVVFALPDRGPDLDGMLVDRGGAPVALAYVDLAPLDPGGIAQQERTDEQGRWSVFALPAGRYLVTAHAAGRGVVATTVTVPQVGVRLQLGGTGRIEGRTPQLARGSFELDLLRCDDGSAAIRLPAERRLVTIRDHAFTIEDVPACHLQIVTAWRDRDWEGEVAVPAGGTARLELDLVTPPADPPRDPDEPGEPDEAGEYDPGDEGDA
ncbi:MAG TPA: carboxypeptidase-like regulatory domain-containing protein, partial [Kofleriaceae bacterium]|nr:carboxypeptidase-like regulatory domain-containing protein [Kofleriaceae bacterium]